MICKYCGTNNDSTCKFCAQCGAPLEAEVNQQNTQQAAPEPEVNTQQAAPEQTQGGFANKPGFSFAGQTASTEGSAPGTQTAFAGYNPPKPKSKKPLIIAGSIVGVVALVTVLCLTVFSGAISRFFVKSFGSPADQQAFAYKSAADGITKTYATIVNTVETLEKTGISGGVKLDISDTAIELLEGYGVDLDDFESLEFTFDLDTDLDNNIFSGRVSLLNNDKSVITMEMVMDLEEMKATMLIPDITDEAVEVDLSDMMGDFDRARFASALATLERLESALPAQKLVEKIVNRYVEALLTSVKPDKDTKATIEVGDVSQKCTSFTVDLDRKVLADATVSVLSTLRDDKDIKKYILQLGDAMDMSYIENEYENFIDSVDDMIEEMEDKLSELDEDDLETIATVVTYVDSNLNLLGVEIELVDMGTMFCGMAETKSEFAGAIYFEFESYGIRPLDISFEGEIEKGLRYGELVFSRSNLGQITIDVEGYDPHADGFVGRFSVNLEDIADLTGQSTRGMPPNMLDVYIEGKLDGKKQTLSVGAEMNGADLVCVTVYWELRSSKPLSLHKNATDPEDWAEEHEDEAREWAEEHKDFPLFAMMYKASAPKVEYQIEEYNDFYYN